MSAAPPDYRLNAVEAQVRVHHDRLRVLDEWRVEITGVDGRSGRIRSVEVAVAEMRESSRRVEDAIDAMRVERAGDRVRLAMLVAVFSAVGTAVTVALLRALL